MDILSFLATTLLARQEVVVRVRIILSHVVPFALAFSLVGTRMSTVGAFSRKVRTSTLEAGTTSFAHAT